MVTEIMQLLDLNYSFLAKIPSNRILEYKYYA